MKIYYLIIIFVLPIYQINSNEKLVFSYCSNDNLEKIQQIDNIKEIFKIKNKNGRSLLEHCIYSGSKKSSLYLVDTALNNKISDINESNLLLLATASGIKKVVERLLDSNPKLVYSLDKYKLSILDYAIIGKRKDIIIFLKEKYYEYFNKNRMNISTIQRAIESNSIDILEKILDSQVRLSEKQISFILQKSLEYSPDTFSYLLSLDYNINSKDDKGNSVLHKLASIERPEVIEYLKSYPVSISKNSEGQTFFHIAAKNGKNLFIKKFIDYSKNINELDNYGNTVLHYAAEYGDSEMIYFLIKQNPDINLRNKKGETPLTISKLAQNDPAYYILLQAGALE